MKTTNPITVAALALASSLVAAQPAPKRQPAAPPAAPPDYTALAEKLVSVSANVKEGEVVAINGGLLDVPLNGMRGKSSPRRPRS